MFDDETLIEELNIGHLSAEDQEHELNMVRLHIGERISEGQSDEALEVYERIINDDKDFIHEWLLQNVPQYEENIVYQEIVAAEADDPEHNNPEKLFANLAWIQLNVPNIQEVVKNAVQSYKDEVAE